MIKRIDKALTGKEKIENNYIGWDGYFYKRRNNPYDVSWGDLCLNYNSPMYETDTCFVVTSWWRHLRWMRASLESYRKTGAFVVVGYDNPFRAWDTPNELEMKRNMPRREHYLLPHCLIVKHNTYDSDKRFGSFWNVKYPSGIMNMFDFKYVFLATTDCVFDKPEGLSKLKDILGDGDLMSVSTSSTPSATGSVHSNSVLFKREAFNKVVDYYFMYFKVPIIGYGCKNLDVMLSEAVRYYKLKEVIAPEQPIYPKDGSIDHYCCYGQSSTWKNVMGFHNLFGEFITAAEESLEPPDKKYVDDYENYLYFDNGMELNPVCKYYQTGDKTHLEQWWKENRL